MKKRKGKRNARRRSPPRTRNAPSGGRTRAAVGRLAQKESLQSIAMTLGGGALGALGAGLAVGAGVKPQTAVAVTLAGGAAGAYFLRGNARAALLGAATAASGQIALAWELQRRAEKLRATPPVVASVPSAPAPLALPPASVPPPPVVAADPDKAEPAPRKGRNGYDEVEDEIDGWRNAWVVEPWADLEEDFDDEGDDAEPVLYADVIEADYELVQ